MKQSAHRFGTRVVGSIDPSALREGLASPGMDTRYWCSRGTVGTVDDNGEEHFDDPHAVWIGPEGVECDVILQPLGQRVTALWGEGGDVTDIAPIRAGDQVVVEFPDGVLMGGKILCIIKSRANKQPMITGKPIFDNKRRLIHAKTAAIDVQTAGAEGGTPSQFFMDQAAIVTTVANRVNLGMFEAPQQAVLGTDYRRSENSMLSTLLTGLQSMAAASFTGPTIGLLPGINAMILAIQNFQTAAQADNDFLSNTVYLKP